MTVLNPVGGSVALTVDGRVAARGLGVLVRLSWRTADWPDGPAYVAAAGLAEELRLVNRRMPAIPHVPQVVINGRVIATPIAPNFVHDGQPYVPLSPAMQSLGFTWDIQSALRGVGTARRGKVVITIVRATGWTTGIHGAFRTVPPLMVVHYYTFVPVSWFAKALGAAVRWNSATGEAVVTVPGYP